MARLTDYLGAMAKGAGQQPREVFGPSDVKINAGYIYAVVNGDHLITMGKSNQTSGRRSRGRLVSLFPGARPAIHNKSFLVGMAPVAFGPKNRYFISETTGPEDAEKIAHKELGITTNAMPAVVLFGKVQDSIAEASRSLFSRALESLKPDAAEEKGFNKVFDLVLSGLAFRRSNGNLAKYSSGDVLAGSNLRAAGKLYLAPIWQTLCRRHFQYTERYLKIASGATRPTCLSLKERVDLRDSEQTPDLDGVRSLVLEEPIIVRAEQLKSAAELVDSRGDDYKTKDFQFETNQAGIVFVIEKPGARKGAKLREILADIGSKGLITEELEPSNHKEKSQYYSEYGSCYFLEQCFAWKRDGYFRFPR